MVFILWSNDWNPESASPGQSWDVQEFGCAHTCTALLCARRLSISRSENDTYEEEFSEKFGLLILRDNTDRICIKDAISYSLLFMSHYWVIFLVWGNYRHVKISFACYLLLLCILVAWKNVKMFFRVSIARWRKLERFVLTCSTPRRLLRPPREWRQAIYGFCC